MECALTLMQGFGLVVDCSALRCVDKAFVNVRIYCDSALPLAKCLAVKRFTCIDRRTHADKY